MEIEEKIHSSTPDTDGTSNINDLLLSYRDSVSKYCYAVTYQNGNKETTDTLALRKHSFLTVLSVADIRLKYILEAFQRCTGGVVSVEQVGVSVSGIQRTDKSLQSIVLNTQLQDALKLFLKYVAAVTSGKTKLNGVAQMADLKSATSSAEVTPDLLKASVELGFELLQSIAKMGDQYAAYGYTLGRIREEQIFLLEYILHGLDVMLVLVHPKMVPSVEAMKNDFLIKCGDYCKDR